jgi:hypothetical protein
MPNRVLSVHLLFFSYERSLFARGFAKNTNRFTKSPIPNYRVNYMVDFIHILFIFYDNNITINLYSKRNTR